MELSVLIGLLILVLLAGLAWKLLLKVRVVRAERDEAKTQLKTLGVLPVVQLESKRLELERQIAEQSERLSREKSEAATALVSARKLLEEARKSIVGTEDLALLQEVGIYRYRHPLTDAVAYEKALAQVQSQ